MKKYIKCTECGNNTFRRYVVEAVIKQKVTKTEILDVETKKEAIIKFKEYWNNRENFNILKVIDLSIN